MEFPTVPKLSAIFPAAAAAAVLVFASHADAQDQRYSMGRTGTNTVSVSVTFSYPVKLPGGEAEEQQKAMETGRRRLYEIADKECRVLLATIASTCRLERLNVNSNVNRRIIDGEQQAQMSASATYRIEPKPEI